MEEKNMNSPDPPKNYSSKIKFNRREIDLSRWAAKELKSHK
jgi:hypothetical protein